MLLYFSFPRCPALPLKTWLQCCSLTLLLKLAAFSFWSFYFTFRFPVYFSIDVYYVNLTMHVVMAPSIENLNPTPTFFCYLFFGSIFFMLRYACLSSIFLRASECSEWMITTQDVPVINAIQSNTIRSKTKFLFGLDKTFTLTLNGLLPKKREERWGQKCNECWATRMLMKWVLWCVRFLCLC